MTNEAAAGGEETTAPSGSRPPRAELALPEGTLNLRRELVPVVQRWLQRGLSESFVKGCVRVEGFEPFSGGLKAALVGGLNIGVRAVLKLGGPELQQHALLLRLANRQRPGTCVEVVDLVDLEGGRWLLTMGRIQAANLWDAVYTEATEAAVLQRAVAKALQGLQALHAVPQAGEAAAQLPSTPDPFGPRITRQLALVAERWPGAWQMLVQRPGLVQAGPGQPALACPPLAELVPALQAWQAATAPGRPRVLVHGDPHLRNALMPRYGRGIAVRYIDPNPEHGFTDAAYDAGKLLHFAEPVGWALLPPERCPGRAELTSSAEGWALRAWLHGAPAAAEQRRARVQAAIETGLATWAGRHGPHWPARLALARASAHGGLLGRMAGGAAPHEGLDASGRFVLAHMLGALAAWWQHSR